MWRIDVFLFVANGSRFGWVFLSYLIAQTTRPEYRKTISEGLLPSWYKYLLKKGFSPPWLDGLSSSNCMYFRKPRCPRWGHFIFHGRGPTSASSSVVYHALYSVLVSTHKIFRKLYEKNPFLCKLIPPAEKLQEALTMIFKEPRLPLVLCILKQYSGLQWPELRDVQKLLDVKNSPGIIMKLCADELSTQPRDFRLDLDCPVKRDQVLTEIKAILAEREEMIRAEIRAGQVTLEQGMVERDDFEGMTSLHASWSQYFEKCAKREMELIANESDKDRHARIQREENRPIRKCKMYTWQAVKTSGGGIIYARTLMKQSEHVHLITQYSLSETKFNARSSEWDFFEEFDSEHNLKERTPYVDADKSDSDSVCLGSCTTSLVNAQLQLIAQEQATVDELLPEEFYTTADVEGYPSPPQSHQHGTLGLDTSMTNFQSYIPVTHTDDRMIERAYWQYGFCASPWAEYCKWA